VFSVNPHLNSNVNIYKVIFFFPEYTMPLKTTVKVSHISNLSDARYCAGMGVEMLGFRVIPGAEDYMAPNLFQDIRGWIAGPAIVAEIYGLSDKEQLEEVVQKYAPDYFELSFEEYRKFEKDLALPCMVYFADSMQARAMPEGKVSHALVDENTTCKDIESFNIPVLINITAVDQLREKLTAACFKGVVLQGPKESRPGITNYEQLGSILEALEEE
jgi:phosphoribosylanthranilate isomerase